MFEISVKIGNDIGNSEHKIIINGEYTGQPNVYARVDKLPDLISEINAQDLIEDIQSNLIVTINSPTIRKGIYYSGYYALKSRYNVFSIEVGADNSKAESDVVVINTLAQIAAYGSRVIYENNVSYNKKIRINVDMAISLPVNQYNKENVEKLKSRFDGVHEIIVHAGDQNINAEIRFEFIKVMPESIPVVFALQRKKKGDKIFKEFNDMYKMNIDGDYFKHKKILHAAIGEGTTEYPITNHVKFNIEFIEGSNEGVGHAIEQILPTFKKNFRLKSFSRQDLTQILKDPSHKYYNKTVELMQIPLSNEAYEIMKKLKYEVEKANNEIDIILVHGGGSIIFKEHLEDKLKALCDQLEIKLFYVPKGHSVQLEAEGLYKFCTGEIFTYLKNS